MIFGGVDIGSSTAKAVILKDGHIASRSIMPVTTSVSGVADEVIMDSLERANLGMNDMRYVISTGYGRNAASFAKRAISEILCHARGVHHLIPQARTIIDIGGQDSKIVWINEKGDVLNFAMNDKCAAGSGRFLELIAHSLGVELERMGEICLKSENPCEISSTCAVFAESEVVSLRADGRSIEDLIAGLHRSIARRVVLMGSRRRFEKEIVFTGGVARNIGVKRALEKEISSEVLVPQEPVLTGALGAALEAQRAYAGLPSDEN